MILTDIRIENFKQYGGIHKITIRDAGMIAVIGANGVGKTTLFEAIEWCLYKPKSWGRGMVMTRNGSGATKVVVQLADPVSGTRYVVERRMVRSGGIEAFVYLADQPESRLVSGSDAVSAYVSRKLIGLNHKAFVSTFFTRQKELSFFGALKPTERRREVGSLLGHDAIVTAGELVGVDEKAAKERAAVAVEVHRSESEGRDFDAEFSASDVSLAAATAALDRAVTVHREYAAALTEITKKVDALREVQRQHQLITNRITALDADHRIAVAEQGSARGNLATLDEDAARRPTFADLASREAERFAILRGHQQERDRDNERRRLLRERDALDDSERSLASDLRSTVESVVPPIEVSGWSVAAGNAPVAAEAERLLATVAHLPVDEAASFAAAIRSCRNAISARDTAAAAEQRLAQQVDVVEQDRRVALAEGDPVPLIAAAEAERERVRGEWVDLDRERKSLEARMNSVEEQTRKLREFRTDEACETCLRPYSAADVAEQIRINGDLVQRLRTDHAPLVPLLATLTQEGLGLKARIEELTRRADAIRSTDARLATIREEHAFAVSALEAREVAVRDALAAAGLQEEPDELVAREAADRAEALSRVVGTKPQLERVRRDARAITANRERIDGELVALGPSRFDPVALEAAEAALQEARAAAVTLREIDDRLARRHVFEAQLREALARADAVQQDRAREEAERTALAFDPRVLEALEADSRRATDVERGAFVEANAAEAAVASEMRNREAIRAAEDRVAALAEDANRKQREADDLSLMREGFREFEKYVAERVNPILGERTAEFLSLVTDGVYDQVEFDSDYGLHVYDDDRPFPISEFSGGERDVAALCARLALSTVIGDQAAHPPGFVVLDEVFGSLDRDRRALVLDTLRNLTGQDHALRQLFVISHVEEVNTSPLLDEVWRVVVEGGVSKVDQDPRDGTISLEAAGALLLEET